ncbi:hypothetical protein DLAC_01912 [Tieghemostelium lacteum]|uniref:Uncharacterized protein n=1 Tax=Tieghemostelium lacteum TaxID=361077 RepID=A0A152A5C2_TIELA|nr:hypothetical protein DLAC_01912 [Tieghemostelium lacteum]|eukprot:KYR01428.1 hypothetical protein DLAC_01912 [Tieghemostelium lacteum]
MFSLTRVLFSGLVNKPIKQTHTWRMTQKKNKKQLANVEDFLRKYNTCYSKNLPKPRIWTQADLPVPLYKQDHQKLLDKYGYGNKLYKKLQKYK